MAEAAARKAPVDMVLVDMDVSNRQDNLGS